MVAMRGSSSVTCCMQTALLELAQEGRQPIGTEGVAAAEAVAGQPLAEHDRNRRAFGVQPLCFESSRDTAGALAR